MPTDLWSFGRLVSGLLAGLWHSSGQRRGCFWARGLMGRRLRQIFCTFIQSHLRTDTVGRSVMVNKMIPPRTNVVRSVMVNKMIPRRTDTVIRSVIVNKIIPKVRYNSQIISSVMINKMISLRADTVVSSVIVNKIPMRTDAVIRSVIVNKKIPLRTDTVVRSVIVNKKIPLRTDTVVSSVMINKMIPLRATCQLDVLPTTLVPQVPTWLAPRDGEPVADRILCSCVKVVLGRGVVGSLTTDSVTKTWAQPTKASMNSKNVIWKIETWKSHRFLSYIDFRAVMHV